jgi:HAD superfamily hydrolase (TIGR01490 family)
VISRRRVINPFHSSTPRTARQETPGAPQKSPDPAPGGTDRSRSGGSGAPPSIECVSHRSAAFFDLDKTIIAKSSTLAFSRPFSRAGLINRRAVLRSAFAQFVYVMNGADHDQLERMREYLSAMCTGWDVEQVRAIVAETLHDLIDPLIYAEAAALIEEHHAAGRDVVIVSSSGAEVVEPIGALLGADRVIATRMVIEDGKYTGEIAFYAYGPNKATAMQELAVAAGYDLASCFAYSDSATDAPMLETVGHPFAVNPDKALREEAVDRGWPILTFATPVGLQRRLPAVGDIPPKKAVTAVAIVGAATAGIVWYARRKARTGS